MPKEEKKAVKAPAKKNKDEYIKPSDDENSYDEEEYSSEDDEAIIIAKDGKHGQAKFV